MASSAPALRPGQTLPGKHWQYKLIEGFNDWGSGVTFKAEVIGDTSGRAPKWAAIKTAPSMKGQLKTEFEEYMRPGVSQCNSIRRLLEVIATEDETMSDNSGKGIRNYPPCLAFEWAQHTLQSITQTCKMDIVLFEAVVTSVLDALVAMELGGRLHADIKADNIFVSISEPSKFHVTLGDFGCATYDGFDAKVLGSFGLCAPEVLEGKGHYHCSDAWALGMTLLKLFNLEAFQFQYPEGRHAPDTVEITQLMQVYPDWTPDPVDEKSRGGMSLQELFSKASALKPLVPIPPLEQQLEGMNAPKELKGMLRLLLSLDVEKRSSASVILQSEEYMALRKAARN